MSGDAVPAWEQRFRAPTLAFPRWARHAPDRMVLASNESGTFQLYAWDRSSHRRRQVTAEAIGVTTGRPSPDGQRVIWFRDPTGDEVGRWVVEPFPGGDAPRDLHADLPEAWSAGLGLGAGVAVVGTADDRGFAVHVVPPGGELRTIHRHAETVAVADLSWDERLVCLAHAEHSDSVHLALRVLDVRTGEVVGDLWDGPGLGLAPAAWAPATDDHRLAVVHEREGFERPGLWDLETGERRDLHIDVPGDVSVADWWPDGRALLLVQSHNGRDQLLRHDLASGRTLPVPHAPGSVSGAGVRPDGQVWLRQASGATPPVIVDDSGAEVVAPSGERAPPGQPFRSWTFTNPAGEDVHGFLVLPSRTGPSGPGSFPLVLQVHGGPAWEDRDDFRPDVQAWVDHDFAVALVNYRGSTGYGVAWRDRLLGDPGFPEVEDVVAGLDALVNQGMADPARAVLAGRSWGGYITLLGIGLHPSRWAAAVAVVPVADYVHAYEEEAPGLQAFDRTLFGGTPSDVPELYEERSPITYVDRVRTPLLTVAGDNDSRCPIGQILNYLERLDARGAMHKVYRYDAGHGSLDTDERVRQIRAELEFVLRYVAP